MKSALRQGIFSKKRVYETHHYPSLNREPLERTFEIIIKTADNDNKNAQVRLFAHKDHVESQFSEAKIFSIVQSYPFDLGQ